MATFANKIAMIETGNKAKVSVPAYFCMIATTSSRLPLLKASDMEGIPVDKKALNGISIISIKRIGMVYIATAAGPATPNTNMIIKVSELLSKLVLMVVATLYLPKWKSSKVRSFVLLPKVLMRVQPLAIQ